MMSGGEGNSSLLFFISADNSAIATLTCSVIVNLFGYSHVLFNRRERGVNNNIINLYIVDK